MPGDENNDAIVPETLEEVPEELANLTSELPVVEEPLPDTLLPEGSDLIDSNASVDEMLSEAAALLPDPMENAPTTALEGQPTFQLKISSLSETQREALKKIVLALKVAEEEACKAFQPLFTHLNEFQVVQLLQELRAVGIHAQADVKWPHSVPSEEEAALGSLASIPDPMVALVEGAPAVTLPANSQDVLLLTTDTLPGYQVQQVMGLVSAHKSIARRFFREQELQTQVEEEIQKYPGKKPQMPKNQLERVFRELFVNLQKNALSLGANGVIGVKIEAFPESSHLDSALEQMRLVALGTAAVVEKSSI